MNKLSKILKKNFAVVIMPIVALAVILVLVRVDKKVSEDKDSKYDNTEKDCKVEEEARKYIPVRFAKFCDLVKAYKESNKVELRGMGELVYNENDSVTTIDVSKVEEYGLSRFKGTQMAKAEWCTETQCFFKTVLVNETDTVVSCPADLLVRLVEDYENSHVSKKK